MEQPGTTPRRWLALLATPVLVPGCSVSGASTPSDGVTSVAPSQSAGPATSPSATPTAPPSASPTPTQPQTPASLARVSVRGARGELSLASAAPLRAERLPEANTRLTASGTTLTLELGPSDVVRADGGGAVIVRTSSGAFLLTATAPSLRVPGKAAVAGRWTVRGHRITAVPADGQKLAGSPPVRVECVVGAVLVSSVSTESWRGQPRWMITPSTLGREAPLPLLTAEGWAQARRAGGIPNTASLRNQFVCHPTSGVARSKPSWNIEAARNASNLWDTMAAGCNP